MQLEEGKVVLTEDNDVYQHLKQTIAVEPNVKYRFSITYNLSAGTLRLDIMKPGMDNAEEHVCSNDITTVMTYNEEVTHEYDIRMAEGQTEFVLDLRNNGPHGAAVGEITNISFVELDARGNPVDPTPSTEAPTTTTEESSQQTEAPDADPTEAPDGDSSETGDATEGEAAPTTAGQDGQDGGNGWIPVVIVAAVVVVAAGGFAIWYCAVRPKKAGKK